jgi:hypothetical protein
VKAILGLVVGIWMINAMSLHNLLKLILVTGERSSLTLLLDYRRELMIHLTPFRSKLCGILDKV